MEKKILFLAVMEAIPTIVCDTLYTLGLHDQIPSWKIMDNKGRITVVLHWEPEDVAALRSSSLPAIAGPSRQSSTCSTIASGGPRLLGIHARSISQVRFWDEFKVKKFQLPCLHLFSSPSPTMQNSNCGQENYWKPGVWLPGLEGQKMFVLISFHFQILHTKLGIFDFNHFLRSCFVI